MKPQTLPAGDPAKNWWTYADIAARTDLSERTVRRRMAEWERAGFPRPLPYSKRDLRWHTAAVLRWLERFETAAMARTVELSVVRGGRA